MGVPYARLWKSVNRFTLPLAGFVPWWIVLETTGRRTGMRRLTSLAGAPFDGSALSVLSVHGDSSAWVQNVRANGTVRVKRRGRWFNGSAEVLDPTPEAIAGLGRYARSVLARIGPDPKVVRVHID